jgi:ribosomal protein L40E
LRYVLNLVKCTMTENTLPCKNCGNQIPVGATFCGSCGAKIETSSLCPHCGSELPADATFCGSCGAQLTSPPVPTTAIPPAPVPEPAPAVVEVAEPVTPQQPVSVAQHPVEEKPAPAEVTTPVFPTGTAPEASDKIPDKKETGPQTENVQKMPGGGPVSRTGTLVIAGIAGLVIIAVLAYFILLPMLAAGAAVSGSNGTPVTGGSSQGSASGTTSAGAGSGSLVTEPTQVPPTALLVTYQAERDPITGVVTVTYTGGAGQNGVSDVLIRLTRSDGQVITRNGKPTQIGSSTTLQGTKMTDRIEVIASYYNGDTYRIIDDLFEYKKR